MDVEVERIDASAGRTARTAPSSRSARSGPTTSGCSPTGFERLSPESRYRRFFRPLTELSERDLAYLTEIDHHDHEALAAIDPETGRPGRQSRGTCAAPSPSSPRSRWSSAIPGSGAASPPSLLEHLVERARAAGITHFVALVMDENTDAIKLFEHRVPGHARPRRSALRAISSC